MKLKGITWMHRLLHRKGHVLFHTIRLLRPALIVELLGRVLKLMWQPGRLMRFNQGLEISLAVLGTNSKLEKIPVL